MLAWVVVGMVGAPCLRAQPASGTMEGDFWKTQGLSAILPAWTEHAADPEHGAFHAYLDRRWKRYDGTSKYPGMVARHVYSYAAAYLLDGDERHLRRASDAVDFMIEHGWDARYGGWYNEVSRAGDVVDPGKDLFMQIYAVTGLSLYYIATQDARARTYIQRTRRLLEQHAWDVENGGYVRSLNRDLSVHTAYKDFSPQLAPLSGYLLYLYPATRDSAYLERAEEIMALVLDEMRDERGWVLERFAADWRFLPEDRKNSHINVGHNVETAWLLLRLAALTGNARYRKIGLELGERLLTHAFDAETGAWTHKLRRIDVTEYPDEASWWVQAYGNMFQLYCYRVTGEERYLDNFRAGARFWNRHFVDRASGGTVLKVALDGTLADGRKAVRTKTSYHAMEHALLNYLYLNLWVRDRAATLHYRIDDPEAGARLYPLPIEDTSYRIERVLVNGSERDAVPADRQFVRFPDDGPVRIQVTLHNEPESQR